MTRSPDHRPDPAATAAALTAQAVALERRVVELRRELADVTGRMTAIAEALGGLRAAGLLPDQAAGEERRGPDPG
ncbi:hypothetical protein PV392_00100 [Streptomyces sp. ME03-5709C]|nr:hypothetical protein [Streptomyces sp. ME03-5709C]